MELRHKDYVIVSELGKITIKLSKDPIAKFYKFNNHITIGLAENQDTVTIELRYKPEEDKPRKPIQLILKHKVSGGENENVSSGSTVRKRHSGL